MKELNNSSTVTTENNIRKFRIKQFVTLNCHPGNPNSNFRASMSCHCGEGDSTLLNSSIITHNFTVMDGSVTISLHTDTSSALCKDTLKLKLNVKAENSDFRPDTVRMDFNMNDFSLTNLLTRACNDSVCSDWFAIPLNQSYLTISNNRVIILPVYFADISIINQYGMIYVYNDSLKLLTNHYLEFAFSFSPNCDSSFTNICQSKNYRFNRPGSLGQAVVRGKTAICGLNLQNSINLPTLQSTATTAQLGGGCEEEDVDTGTNYPPVDFNYTFALSDQNPFLIMHNNYLQMGCAEGLTYRFNFETSSEVTNPSAVSSFSDFTLNGFDLSIHQDGHSFYVEIPDSMLNLQALNTVHFNYKITACPFMSPQTFGELVYEAYLSVSCASCLSHCTQKIACNNSRLYFHCPGNCGNNFLTSTSKAETERQTFGWANRQSFMSDSLPLTLSNYDTLNAPIRKNELRKVYSYDLFKIKAEGAVSLNQHNTGSITQLGMEIAFSQELGVNVFDLISASIILSDTANNNIIDTIHLNVQNIIPNTGEIAGISAPFFIYELLSDSLGAFINLDYMLNFEGLFRVNAPIQNPTITDQIIDFRLQFINRNTVSAETTSCDPYGTKVRVLYPTYSQIVNTNTSGNTVVNGNWSIELPQQNICLTRALASFSLAGGIGPFVDDFPYEYRPVLHWNTNGQATRLLDVIGMVPPDENYAIANNTFTNENFSTILRPMEKGDTLFTNAQGNPVFAQGLGLVMQKSQCPLAAQPPDTISLGTRKYAYLNEGHLLDSLIPIQAIPNIILSSQSSNTPSCASLAQLKHTTTGNPNLQPTVNVGDQLPFLLRLSNTGQGGFLWAYVRVNNCNSDAMADTLALNGAIPAGVNQISVNGGFLFYTDTMGGQNIDIPLLYRKRGCSPCSLLLRRGIMCTTPEAAQLHPDTLTSMCASCTQNFDMQPDITANLSNPFKQFQYIVEDGFCGIEYAARFVNSFTNPAFSLDSINISVPAGLVPLETTVLQSGNQTVLSNFTITSQNNSGMTPVVNIQFNDTLILQAGDTLWLRIRFRIYENLCSIPLGSNHMLLGAARATKECSPTAQFLSLSHTFEPLSMPFLNDPACCFPVGISISHDTICDSSLSTGSITVGIEHPDNDSLSQDYAHDFSILLIGPDTSIVINNASVENVFNDLPLGVYNIFIQNNQQGIFQTSLVQLFNRSLQLNITASADTICAGEEIQLILTNSNPAGEPIESIEWYSFLIPTEFPIIPILINQNIDTLITNAFQNTIYFATASNVFGCSSSAPSIIIVNPLPIVNISGVNDTVCAAVPFNPMPSPPGGTLWLNGLEIPELPIDLSTFNEGDFQLIYSFTDSLGCTASDTANFWLNTEPLCPCPVCPDPDLTLLTIPDSIVVSSQLGPIAFQNLCIRINHDFTFDQMTTINNCHFIMAEGVRIINLSALRILNSTFEGCEFLWHGIINSGQLGAQACEFRDAFTAIVPMRQTYGATHIKDCRFENNFIGIMNGAGFLYHSISINYSTFKGGILKTPAQGMNIVNNWSFAGIRLHNKMSLMSFESNIFDSLCVGLFSDQSFFDSKSNRFENIMNFDPQYAGSNYFFDSNQGTGTAIYATRSVGQIVGNWPDDEVAINFNNTTTAVYNFQGPLTIKNCRFNYDVSNPIKTGIRIFNSAIHDGYWITKNAISADFTAIELNDFNNNNPVEIDNNTIVVSGLGPLARWGIRINNFPEQENLRITNNEISMMNYTMFGSSGNLNGIAISNGSKYIVFKNKINIIGRSGNGLTLNGINFSRIQCNDISGSPVPSYPFGTNQLVSLRQSHSNDCRISQNYTNGANTGMLFAGTNNATDLRCNTIGSHHDGLFISSGTIGDQNYKHNRWTGSYTGFGARVGIGNENNNRFYVHAGADATYYPYYFPNYNPLCNLGDFFQCDQIIQPNCVACGATSAPPSGIAQEEGDSTKWLEIARKLALDSLQFPEYNQEFRFYTLRDLEAAMQAGAVQLPDTGIFIAFKASLQSSVATSLNQPEHWMKNALPDSSLRSELDIYHQQWLELMQQLKGLDSIIANENIDSLYLPARQGLLSQINLVEQQMQLIRQGALSAQAYTRDSAFAYLGGVVTQAEFEEYDRTISQIYLSTVAQGLFNFSPSDSASIYSIASLCPALGGKAVYKARSLYTLLNDSIYFDDDSLCVSQSVMFRQTSNNISEIQQIEFAKVYPNPTSNIFIIEFIDMKASPVTLKLRDNMGRLIEQKVLNNQINTINLIESITYSGLYLYELVDDKTGRKQIGKISFIK